MIGRLRLCRFVMGAFFVHAAALSLVDGVAAQTPADPQPALTAPLALTPSSASSTRVETDAPRVVLSPPIPVAMPPAATAVPAPQNDGGAAGVAATRSMPPPLPARPVQTNAQNPALRLDDLVTAATAPDARIYFHYSTLQDGGEDTARQYAHHILDNGFLSLEIRPVSVAIKTASVRYFYEDDRGESERLSQVLQQLNAGRGLANASYTVVDFLRFTPKPRKGTIEVWIPNELRLRPNRTDVSARPQANSPAAAVR